MRRLYRASVWHPSAFGLHDSDTDKELKRYTLPAFDLLMAIMGILGITRGMPSFTEVYGADVSVLAGGALLAAALIAFVGIAFPRLWVAEAVGKVIMFLVIGSYATALWVLNFQGVGERWIVAVAFTGLMALPAWNVFRIGRERRRRESVSG